MSSDPNLMPGRRIASDGSATGDSDAQVASAPHSRRDAVEPSDELQDALVLSAFRVTALLSEIATANELSLTQLRLLAILRDREPTMSVLAQFLGLDRSSVSGLVDRAAARGLVQRIPDPADRRSARVALTRAGRTLAQAGTGAVSERLAPSLSSLSATERKRLAVLLERTLAPPHGAA